MLFEEGLDTTFARHRRLADAVQRCGRRVGTGGARWSSTPSTPTDRATSVTTVRVAKGIDANRLRLLARDELDVSLGSGLGPLDGKAFRIGHMGWVNEPMVLGALGAVEMAMQACGVPHRKGGVTAAVDALVAAPVSGGEPRARSLNASREHADVAAPRRPSASGDA